MTQFLVWIAVILGIAALTMLANVFELAATLKGSNTWKPKESDNRFNGRMMLVFMVAFMWFCGWQFFKYSDKLLPVAASEFGKELDWLFNFNMIIISFVFVVTNVLLFYFSYKYYGRDNGTATYFPHNNRLELLWTTVPAIVLAIIIVLGLKSWTKITAKAPDDAMVIELYAKQFDWTARYAGADNKLGASNYRLIDGTNALGLDPDSPEGKDDILARNEFHIPLGKMVEFKIRSRDVIHSAFMPHFRAQMNAVPGQETMLHFTPTITTDSMRLITKNPKFDYLLLCNKICGASHYNMQMNIIVDTPEEFQKWMSKQKPFFAGK